MDRGQPGGPAAVGRRQEVQDPRRHAEHARRWPRTCPPSRPTCASRSRAPTTRRRAHIMSAAVEGAQVDFDNASEIEGRYFVDLVTGQVAKNMIQAFFFDLQRATGDRGRPDEIETFTPNKVVVLGAGMMGAAIAYVCAKAGPRGRAQGRRSGRRRPRQGLLREAGGQGGGARTLDPGEGRRAAGADHRRPPTPPPPRAPSS